MIDYMNTICEKDFRKIKKIIDHKFRKFRSFYWLLKDYSENIYKIRYYDDTDIDTFRIDVSVSGKSGSELAKILLENVDEEEADSITITYDEEIVSIEIYREEEHPMLNEDDEETSLEQVVN